MKIDFNRESGGFMDDRERPDGTLMIVKVLTPGTILVLTSGEYSDYSIDTAIRVVRAFRYAEALQSWCDLVLAEAGGLQRDETIPDGPNKWKELAIQKYRGRLAELTDLLGHADEMTAIKEDYARRIEATQARLIGLGYGVKPQKFYEQATIGEFLKWLKGQGFAEEIDLYEFNWDVD